MSNRALQCFALVGCIGLLASMAQARATKKPAHRLAKATSARRVTLPGPKGKSVRKTAAKHNSRKRGQQVMEAKRVRQIQAALIRDKYLKGRPSGVWDERSKQAMARFQSDNQWQSKVVPDSRALIKLGLGPDYAGLLNPDTAIVSFIPRQNTPTASSRSQR